MCLILVVSANRPFGAHGARREREADREGKKTTHRGRERTNSIGGAREEKGTYSSVLGPCVQSPQAAAGGNKTQGSNTIMSTSFALKFWSNKIIDVDTILSIILIVS